MQTRHIVSGALVATLLSLVGTGCRGGSAAPQDRPVNGAAVIPMARPMPPLLDGEAPPDQAPPPEAPVVEARFVWPVNAWVAATYVYETGEVHTGSADLAVPHYTPVGAARAGTVLRAELTSVGGWLVELDHGGGYTTIYSHLAEAPYVAVGDTVQTNEVVGVSGRTGRALRNGAHLHFGIYRDGDRLVVPAIDFGDWVKRGDPIPGDYEVAPAPPGDSTFPVEVVVPSATVRAGADASSKELGALTQGSVATVLGSTHGHYRIEAAGQQGWLAQSAAAPAGSPVFGLKVLADTTVREAPDAGASSLGSLAAGELVTAFEESGGWFRVLYGLPTRYGWVAAESVTRTPEFEARLRARQTAVHAGAGLEFPVVGTLVMFDSFVVVEVVDEWFRIQYEGGEGWIPGSLTQGRL